MTFDVKIQLTASKILAYAILITGVVYAFINKSSEVFIFAGSTAAALHGVKSWQQEVSYRKQVDSGISNRTSEAP